MDFIKRILGISERFESDDPLASLPDALGVFLSNSYRFIAIDVETANSFNGSICQIGLAGVCADGRIVPYSTYVDPEEAFASFNKNLHGIDERTVHGSGNFPVHYASLLNILSQHKLIQHSNFDKSAFHAACAKYGIPPADWNWFDSVQIARRAWPQLKGKGGHGLANLKTFLSLVFDHHDAGEDARAAALVVQFAEKQTGQSFEELLLAARSNPKTSYQRRITAEGNPSGALAGHIAVFTGALTVERGAAVERASRAGITVAGSVTKKTTLLIVGDQDLALLGGHEKSAKHRKAEELIAQGQSLSIMCETEFFIMLEGRN